MSFIGADIQDAAVLDVLDKLVGLSADLNKPMQQIADFMESQVRIGFMRSQSPWGDKWAPVQRGGQPLINTRNLLGNISRQYGADFAEVGTNVEYAPVHQFGNKKGTITPRPFLPLKGDDVVLPEYWIEDILDILETHLKSLTDG